MIAVTTRDLINDIRAQSQEPNTATIDDDMLLAMMNRGLRYITQQLVRVYPEPLLKRAYLSAVGYNLLTGLEIPTDAYEDRVLFVQVNTPGGPTPVRFRTYRQIHLHEVNQYVATPAAWYIRGRRIFFAPPAAGTYQFIVDYVKRPDQLVLPLGRINTTDITDGFVIVDPDEHAEFSTDSDQLGSYVNVVDYRTGEIKGTFQIGYVDGNKLGFLATPIRSTVLDRTVSSSSEMATLGIAQDDYVCSVKGTCVPQFGDNYSVFLVHWGTAEVNRALGEAMTQIAEAITKQAEDIAKQQDASRPESHRVKNRSPIWGLPTTVRWPFSRQ